MFIPQCKQTLAFLLVAALAGPARADEIRPLAHAVAESRAKLLAPFVDDQTIGVARVDATQIDADKLFDLAKQFLPAGHPLLQSQPLAANFVHNFTGAGGREVYFVASLADLPEQPPFIIVPLGKDSDGKRLSSILAAFQPPERIGGVLFAGSPRVRMRLKDASPESRPELSRALEAAGDAQLQIILMPSATARRVAEELMPFLPAPVGGGPTRMISRGALWAALSMNGPPEIGLRLILQSQDASAAALLRGQWRHLLATAWPQGADKISDTVTPQVMGDRLVLQLRREEVENMAKLVRPGIDLLSSSVRRRESTDSLKRIGIAMHNYADHKKHFPPAAIADADGQPLLSWRVAVLPYLGEEMLFKEFHLDEPWDSEHNRKLIGRMPAVFRSFGSAAAEHRTCYVVPVGPGSVFEGQVGTGFGQITDGTSNTVMAIEIADEQAVVWSQPDDYKFDPKHPADGLTSPYSQGRLVLFCDGSVHFITQQLDDETLRRLLVRDDGQPIPALK